MIVNKVSPEKIGVRLDVFVHEQLPEASRSFARKLIDTEQVTVNGILEKASYKLRDNDKVEINFSTKEHGKVPRIDMDVLYEDEDCLVLNKPAGVLTHSKGSYNPEATVATYIFDKLTGLDGDRAGIVHRLDRATSGVIIAAKSPEAMKWLQKQFSLRKVKKTYYAIIAGHLEEKEALIDMPIERHPRTPKTFRTSLNGKPATTHYKVVESGQNYDLVRLQPTTGRTHQLRVHMKQLGHPILGDVLYEGPSSDRMYLHAQELELTLPNKTRQVFTVPLPEEFRTIMKHDENITAPGH